MTSSHLVSIEFYSIYLIWHYQYFCSSMKTIWKCSFRLNCNISSSALIWVVSRNVDSQVKMKYVNNNVNKNNLLVLLKSDTNVKTWNDVLIFLVINFKAILKKMNLQNLSIIKKRFLHWLYLEKKILEQYEKFKSWTRFVFQKK
jgi:hypothetical protein